ncbi:MAG: LysE family transporter, partial [Oscillospiraceae bacterium]
QNVMIGIGAAYILWLAADVWLARPQKKRRASPRPDSLLTGALLQFMNPHAVMYGLTAMSGFVLPVYGDAPGLLALFVLLLSAIGWLGVVCWAIFGAVFHSFFAAHQRLLDAILSL